MSLLLRSHISLLLEAIQVDPDAPLVVGGYEVEGCGRDGIQKWWSDDRLSGMGME